MKSLLKAYTPPAPQASASSFAVALAFLAVIPQGSASSFGVAVVVAFLSVIPSGNLLLPLRLS